MKNKEKYASKEKEKEKKNAWLQACFLGDVGVIWCNSLGGSHFQTFVMDNVESVFILCLHSLCKYLMHLLVTHATSKSLLNTVHVIVCYVLWLIKIKFIEVFNAILGCEKR